MSGCIECLDSELIKATRANAVESGSGAASSKRRVLHELVMWRKLNLMTVGSVDVVAS